MSNSISNQNKIIVALSGGVDSAVALYLLQKQGFEVEGVFMKNWSGTDFGMEGDCPWEKDQLDAQAVCEHLNVPFRSVNFEREYRDKVLDYFFKEYAAGRTPNPDVMCNREIKFKVFLEKALALSADKIATGHYAGIVVSDSNGEYQLLKGKDRNKDQSYFLHQLNQYQLSRTLFPLGDIAKTEVRRIAFEAKLPVAAKKDSQGICFVGKVELQKFLQQKIPPQPGEIIDADNGRIIGTHEGISYYTIGQREGLGIGGAAKPYFVVDKDADKNILYVAAGKKNPRLFKKTVVFTDLHLINSPSDSEPTTAIIRYRQEPQAGILNIETNSFNFTTPQRAVSPGQNIVFYQGDICLGGAIIVTGLN